MALVAITAIIATLGPAPCRAQQPVYFAGLAYLGDFQYVEAKYPLTRQLDGEIQSRLRDALPNIAPRGLEIRTDLADLHRTETIVLAVAVDRERISREVFDFDQGIRTKLIVELSLQLLFYDLAAGILVDNRPISAAINHVVEGRKTDLEAESLDLMRRLYFGNGESGGLLGQVVDRLERFELRPADRLRFRLDGFAFDDRVLPVLPKARSAVELGQGFGQWFSARLAEHARVSVIPFTRGYAIGNQLPGRFANGEAFNLKLPEPDYALRFEIRNLTKNEHEGQILFAAQAHFTFEEPFTQTVLIDGDYRLAVAKLASAARIEADDWSAYEDAVENLLDDIVTQLTTPERSWHASHARDEKSFGQFKAHKELFHE